MALDDLWSCRRISVFSLLGIAGFLLQSLVAVSLNDEGMALLRFKDGIENDPFGALLTWKESNLENNPCSWFGVECVDGHVVSLKLKDFCLAGVLVPELGHLVHIKLIILRNNSLSGAVPEELAGLKELEVLDLGFNHFSGTLPHEWGNKVAVLLLDNNGQFCHVPPEVEQLMMISEVQAEESDLSSIRQDSSYNLNSKSSCVALSHPFIGCDHQTKNPMLRRELQEKNENVSPGETSTIVIGEPIPGFDGSPPPPLNPPEVPPPPPPPPSELETPPSSPISPDGSPTESSSASGRKSTPIIAITVSVAAFVLLSLVIVGLFIWRRKKIATVGPWRSGMSGRIQRSVANGDDKIQILSRDISDTGPTQGTPILKRSELEAACEEFSNVIGSSSIGTLYKGTLSSTGAEIAVLSYSVKHTKDWSNDMQMLFRKKVDKLSKFSHKNFLNLIAYCEEEKPFTRMLVFEYAPSGTLFEHLYVRESEHLDWTMRLRIIMGIAYCLEHMHSLNPCATHEDLTPYAVNLSEDYATKLSDFSIWNEVALAARPIQIPINTPTSLEVKPEDNVYSFGLVLLEMMTGKTPYSTSSGSLDEWAINFLRGEKPLEEFVDPMLRHFDVVQLERIGEVIKLCTLTNPNERPRMEDLASRLREITDIAPDKAAPRLTIWWPQIGLQLPHSQAF